MDGMEKYIHQSEEYERAKLELREQEAKSERRKETEVRECAEKFDALISDIGGFQAKLKDAVDILCEEIYPDILQKVNGRFTVCGQRTRAVALDAEGVFSVVAKAQKQTVSALRALLDESCDASEGLSAFVQGYNTVADARASAQRLKEDALENISRRYDEERRRRKEKAEQIESDWKKALCHIPELLAENEKTRDRVFLNGNFAVRREFSREVCLPFGYRTTPIKGETTQEIVTKIASWDWSQDAVLHMTVRSGAEEHAAGLIENTVLQLLKAYPVQSVKVAVCNPGKDDSLTSFFGRINGDEFASSLLFRSKRSSATELEWQDIEKSLKELSATLSHRLELLDENQTVLTFNEENQDTAYPLVLLVLDGYSDDYRNYSETLKYLFSKGLRGGIYTLAVEKEEKSAPSYHDSGAHVPDLAQTARLSCQLSDENGKAVISLRGEEFSAEVRDGDFVFLNALNHVSLALRDENKYLPLTSILKGEVATGDFSQIISIPIGKAGSDKIRIRLDTQGPDAHAVIAGTSGSGKSSLLQSMILGGAYLYSPDELQFWVLDFKDGLGLVQFQALKHVKMMSVRNRAINAMEIMGYIQAEYKRRSELIHKSGGGDIVAYNRKMRSCGGKQLPRLVIVIDEFAQMPAACSKVTAQIAHQGRATGIGLVLSSQIVERNGNYQDAVGEARHRFEFMNQNVGHLIGSVSDAEKSFVNNGAKGNCLYQNGNIVQMRAAYAGAYGDHDCPQEKLMREINEKWAAYPYEKPIVTGNPERNIRKRAENAFDAEEAKQNYAATKKIFVPVGVSRLGEEYRYKIDRDNPVLFVCGDEKRAASLEYSVASRVAAVADGGTGVYYLDLNANPDRENNPMLESRKEGSRGIIYARSVSQIGETLNRAYGEYKRRKALIAQDKLDEVGNPMEMIIHNADRINEVLPSPSDNAGKHTDGIGDIQVPSLGQDRDIVFTEDTDLFSFAAQMGVPFGTREEAPEVAKTDEYNDISPMDKLKEIIRYGRDCRMFAILHFENADMVGSVKDKLFVGEFKVKDMVVIPTIPEEDSVYSGKVIGDYLTACGVHRMDGTAEAANAESNDMRREDFYYAVLMDDNIVHKMIPYEWEG